MALSLLRTRPRFRALWLAIAISYTGSGAAATVLTLYVQERQGTGIAVGALLLAEAVPQLFGPLTGAIVDRIELRSALVLCDLGGAACFAVLATLPPFGPLLVLAAMTALLRTLNDPARMAAIPALVEEGELLGANATLGLAFNLYIAIGPLVGGVLFALSGPTAVLWLNVASFLVSALLLTRMPRLDPGARRGGAEIEAILASIRAGTRYVRSDPLLRTLILSILFGLIFLAVDGVASVFLVRTTLGGSAAAYGIVSACFGAGMIAASLGVLARLHVPAPRVYLAGMVLFALGTLLTGVAPLILLVAVAQGLCGAGNGVINIGSDTIIQRFVPREMTGRVTGLLLAAISIGFGAASLLGGFLVDATSPRATFLIAGAGAILVAALAAPTLRRVR